MPMVAKMPWTFKWHILQQHKIVLLPHDNMFLHIVSFSFIFCTILLLFLLLFSVFLLVYLPWPQTKLKHVSDHLICLLNCWQEIVDWCPSSIPASSPRAFQLRRNWKTEESYFQTPLQLGMKEEVVDSVLPLFAPAARPGGHLAIWDSVLCLN